MKNILLPIGLGLAAFGLLYIATTPSAPKAGGAPPPGPLPGGAFPGGVLPPAVEPAVQPGEPQLAIPGFPGVPASNVDVIRSEVNTLLAQATLAPNTVKPEVLDQLSIDLARAGFSPEAKRVSDMSRALKEQIPVLIAAPGSRAV